MALTPAVVSNLCKKGFNINVQDGAGVESQFRNIDYEAAGAGSGSKEESSVTKVKQHKKILDRGKPDDLMPGLKKSQEPLPGDSFDKFLGPLFHHVEKIRQMKEVMNTLFFTARI